MQALSGAEPGSFTKGPKSLRNYWERTFNVVLVIGIVTTLVILAKAYATNRVCGGQQRKDIPVIELLADCPAKRALEKTE